MTLLNRLVLVAAFSLSARASAIPNPEPPPVYIVGGSIASRGEFPYMVSLQTSSHFCGGVLLSQRQVLTAAHCTFDKQASRVKVRAGSLQHNSGGQLVQAAAIYNHPAYMADPITNDIAIIDLASPVTGISPATLPLALTQPAVNEQVKLVGWGTTSQGASSIPTNLMKVSVNVVSRGTCQQAYPDLANGEFCTTVPGGGKDACQGDSGGPVIEGNNTVIGVISFGKGCARAGYPGVQTQVSSYELFITEHLVLDNLP